MKTVWGYTEEINTRTVDTHVCRIRKKLNLVPEEGWQLLPIYNYGYRLEFFDNSKHALNKAAV